MADKDLFILESYLESDSIHFDSEDIGELDTSDPLAVSGRCDHHKGLSIEVTKDVPSMRCIANIVIALQRLKHTETVRFRSTEFTDPQLFQIFLENVIEDTTLIDLKCSESKSYSVQDKAVQCTICDKFKKALVYKNSHLLAITLKGGHDGNKTWFNISAYTPPNCRDNPSGQAVCLGIVKSNLFLSCTLKDDVPSVRIEEVKDKEHLKEIKEGDGMERFLFFRKSDDSINTFESVKYPGWFISTLKDEFNPVEMSKGQTSEFQLFTLHDERVVPQSKV